MQKEFTLDDLSILSGLPLRTLRYYIQEGLLPGPDTQGKYARYSQSHVDALLLIQRLKDLRLPLQEIRFLLANMTSDEVVKLLQFQSGFNQNLWELKERIENRSAKPEGNGSALAYIRNLQETHSNLRALANQQPVSPSPLQNSPAGPDHQMINESINQYSQDVEAWQRIEIAEGVELHIRADIAAGINIKKEIGDLIAFARRIIKKPTSGGKK